MQLVCCLIALCPDSVTHTSSSSSFRLPPLHGAGLWVGVHWSARGLIKAPAVSKACSNAATSFCKRCKVIILFFLNSARVRSLFRGPRKPTGTLRPHQNKRGLKFGDHLSWQVKSVRSFHWAQNKKAFNLLRGGVSILISVFFFFFSLILTTAHIPKWNLHGLFVLKTYLIICLLLCSPLCISPQKEHTIL